MPAPQRYYQDFPSDFTGEVLRPGDSAYEQARSIYNGRARDKGPSLIARCSGTDEVATVVRYASERKIPIAVRGGGHMSDGLATPGDALVIDLSAMRAVAVDAERRVVRAQPGVLLGELDAATQEYGLVVPAGTVTSTGVAGLTLGGGIGHLMRRFGATVDNLLSCEMVTLCGDRVRASENENPELFWSLRGGGGNFGIVTEFEYRAHHLGTEVVSGQIIFSGQEAETVLLGLPAVMKQAPREIGVLASLTDAPSLPSIPEEAHGKPVVVLTVVYSGAPETSSSVIDPLLRLGHPLANSVATIPWVQANSALDKIAPYGMRMNLRGGYLAGLEKSSTATLISRAAAAPRRKDAMSTFNIWCMGGAISEDVAEDDMAFSREGAAFLWEGVGMWSDSDDDKNFDSWAETTLSEMRPYTLSNGYTNLTDDQGDEWRRGVHGSEAKFSKLQRVKNAWDPDNLLRFNKNIPPA